MTATVFLSLAILLPIAIAVIMRVNAAVLFMAVCVGDVLNQYINGNALSIAGRFESSIKINNLNDSALSLAILLLPAVLTVIFMFHSVKGSRAILNILPAIATGLLVVILTEPLLAPATQSVVASSWAWHHILSSETALISGGALVCLAFLWFQHHLPAKRHYGHKPRHHEL